MNNITSSDAEKFNRYAITHGMGGAVSDFEQAFYKKYLPGFSGAILDIGSGDGKYTHFFAAESPQSQVVPTDISMVRMERLKSQEFFGPVSSACHLPFRNRVFGRIFLMQVIEHINNSDAVMKECARVLLPDGVCFVTTPNYPIKRFYDWLQVIRYGKVNRIFDDPTHCSKFDSTRLKKVVSRYFKNVEVFPTFIAGEGRFPAIRRWREGRKSSMFFSHKLLAVCRFPQI